MKLIRFLLCSCVFSMALGWSRPALAVRGWLGANWGMAYDESVRETMSVGPTASFIIGKYFFLGGRIEFYTNWDEGDDANQSIYKIFDNQRFIFGPHVGLILPMSFFHVYAGSVGGIDLGLDFWTDAYFKNNQNSTHWFAGGIVGIDFFITRSFSLGLEAEVQRLFVNQGKDYNRAVVNAMLKWQFGNKRDAEIETRE